MDIRQLNYFVQVADCGSYSIASQKLFVSQPALSKAIKSMEDELGITFFYTHNRRQHLTYEGQAFYEKASRLVRDYNSLLDTSYKDADILAGHLSIGLSAAAGTALFGYISPKFSQKYPLVEFSLSEKSPLLLKEDVFKRDIDAAYLDATYISKEETELFDIIKIGTSDLVAVVHSSDPLSSADMVSLSDLDGKDMVFYKSDDTSMALRSYDSESTLFRPNIKMGSSQWYLLLSIVESGRAMTIVPYCIYDWMKRPDLVALPIDSPRAKRPIAIITKKGESRSRVLNLFLDFASDEKNYEDFSTPLEMEK